MVGRHLRFNEIAGAQISLAGQSRRGDGGEYSSLQSEIYRHWVFKVCSKLISQEISFEMGWHAVLMKPWFRALAAVTPYGPESRSYQPPSPTQRSHGGGVDNNWGPALISNYTGKEVVG
jgi:hypothetical protein